MKNIQQLNHHVELKSLMLQVQTDIKNNYGEEALENMHQCLVYMIHQFICAKRRDLAKTEFEYRLNMLCQSGAIKNDYSVLHHRIIEVFQNGAEIQAVRQVYTFLLDLVDDFLETVEYPLVLQTNHPQLDQIVFDYRIFMFDHDYPKAAISMKALVEYMITQYELEYSQDMRIQNWSIKCDTLANRNLITRRTADIWKGVCELGNLAVTWNQPEDIKVDEVKQYHALLEETKNEFFARFPSPSEKEYSRRDAYIHEKAYNPNGGAKKSPMVYTTHVSKEEIDQAREKREQREQEEKANKSGLGETISNLKRIGLVIGLGALLLAVFFNTVGKLPIFSLLIVYAVYKIIKRKKGDHTEEK